MERFFNYVRGRLCSTYVFSSEIESMKINVVSFLNFKLPLIKTLQDTPLNFVYIGSICRPTPLLFLKIELLKTIPFVGINC